MWTAFPKSSLNIVSAVHVLPVVTTDRVVKGANPGIGKHLKIYVGISILTRKAHAVFIHGLCI